MGKETFEIYNTFVALMAPFECYTPKFHVVWHCLYNQKRQGNPTVYSNWMDETLNKSLKGTCRFVSQATFEASVLLRMALILKSVPKRPLE